MNRKGSPAIWGLIIALTFVSGVLAWAQLSGLPDLDVMLDPELTVRDVAVEPDIAGERQTFQRGDQIKSIEGMTVERLTNLRAYLPDLIAGAEPPEFEQQADDARQFDHQGQAPPEGAEDFQEYDEGIVALDYKIERPVQRFSIIPARHPDREEWDGLPPEVQEDDRLVEIDGRELREPRGVDGIRNVVDSMPEAHLVFERREVVKPGQLLVDETTTYPGVLVGFLLMLGVVGVLWRWHSETVGARAAYCIGLETACMGWLALLVFSYQWVLGDYILAGAVVAGLVMLRPLSMLARQQADSDGSIGGLVSVAVGGVSAAVIIALMATSTGLASAEEALHAAAIVAGLFIIYELAAGGVEGQSPLNLGERGGYLAGIVVLGLFVCGVALVVEPVAFREDRWRWFAVSLPALLWFGDVLYAVKYGAHSAMGQVADQRSRRDLVGEYLREMALEMPHTDLRLVGVIEGRSIELRSGYDGFELSEADESVADAVEIMVTENARVPLPEGFERQSHPMAGIAQAMNISLALVLTPPAGSLRLEGQHVDIALVGTRESADGDVPAYASSETLDRAQQLWNESVASAAVIEVMAAATALQPGGAQDSQGGPALREQLEEAKQRAAEAEEQSEQLARRRQKTDRQLEANRRRVRLRELTGRPRHPRVDDERRSELLEEELLEALEFLFEQPEPIVFAGPVGAGKGFTACQAHRLDGGERREIATVDAARSGSEEVLDEILGEEGGGEGPGLLEHFQGAVLVRAAQRCDDARLLALCHQCEEKDVRLYLNFEADDAEQRSVLEGRHETLQELLGHREVIIPRFVHRHAVMLPVLEFWLRRWAGRYDKRVEGFSRMAVRALEGYDFPGEVAEAVEVARLAVLDAGHDVIDRENLPIRVRQAQTL